MIDFYKKSQSLGEKALLITIKSFQLIETTVVGSACALYIGAR